MEQQYTTLTKDINNIDNKDAIVYAYIKSRMNYKTSIADNVTEKEISEKLGISLSTVKRSVSRLKNNKNLIDKVISNNVIAEEATRRTINIMWQNVMKTSSIFITVSLMMI